MIKFLAPLCLLIACSCAKPVVPANVPTMPEQKVATINQTNPLEYTAPAFKELKKNNYSLSIPYEFINLETPGTHTDLDFSYASPDKNMQISIASDSPKDMSLEDYSIGFARVMVGQGQKLLAHKEGVLAGFPATMIAMGEEDAQGQPEIMSFYFLTMDNQKRPYAIACYIAVKALKDKASVCFDIVKSMKIDSVIEHNM